MFFPERIRAIGPRDRVLEIGPGSKPHRRSDVLLEHSFDDETALRQRGGTPPLKTSKEIVFYDGKDFPFKDKEFDYVICSHVIEHVTDVEKFCSEMFRVATKGYLEFPTVYYEYLYNFSVHLQLLNYRAGELRYMSKADSGLSAFAAIQSMFYRSLEMGSSDLVDDLKLLMFQGLEWDRPFPVRRVNSIGELTQESPELHQIPVFTRYARRILRRLGGI